MGCVNHSVRLVAEQSSNTTELLPKSVAALGTLSALALVRHAADGDAFLLGRLLFADCLEALDLASTFLQLRVYVGVGEETWRPRGVVRTSTAELVKSCDDCAGFWLGVVEADLAVESSGAFVGVVQGLGLEAARHGPRSDSWHVRRH